jgi:lipopolysaccharide/colanic/teichoic acid biosynthesis glycosyltransferase
MESTITSTANKKLASATSGAGRSGSRADRAGAEGTFKVQGMITEQTINEATRAQPRAGIPLWKRALDGCLMLIGLPLWLPVALVIALVIRVGSRGPVFFRQRRVGQGGRQFVCFKFRTMHLNASQSVHQNHVKDMIQSSIPMVKLDDENDSRLIPGGSWIRASGLDELPQLFNILRGEMSLVGPRPCIPYEYEMYQPWQRRRCDAPPGLTGLWQVSGKNHTTFNEMVQLDIEYARRMSPWLDFWIIVRTPLTILQQLLEARAARKSGQQRPHGASKN